MKHRYTIKDLQTLTDDEMLRGIVADRMDDCTNIYAPLYVRLQNLYTKIEKRIMKSRASRKTVVK